MKWIGQHIWDFISRFRSDVYLESVDSGTIASGGNLGLDSNNKIVKATGVGSASTVTVTDSSASTAFPVVFHDESNNLLDDTGGFTYNPSIGTLDVSSTTLPMLTLQHTSNSALDPHLNFYNTKDGGSGADNDDIGTISFYAPDAAGNAGQQYGTIRTSIAEADHTDEAGIMRLTVATEGVSQQGLTISGDGASSKVDIGLGYGTSSLTTIAGDLTANGEDVLFTSSTSNKPVVEIKNTNTDVHDPHLKFNNTKGGSTNGADGDAVGTIEFWGVDGSQNAQQYGEINTRVDVAAHGQESGAMYFKVANHDGGVLNGLTLTGGSADDEIDVAIGAGVSSMTTIAGDLDIDGDAITSAGALKITPADVSGVAFLIDADADTDNEVQIDAGLLDLNVSTTATLDAATSWTVTSPEVVFTSSTSQKPIVEITNTTNDANSSTLKFNNTRGDNNGNHGDWLGIVSFFGNDIPTSGPPNSTEYARIYSRIDVATDGQESGVLAFDVANEDGDLGGGLTLTGGSTDSEVDVSIALGLDSLTTINGEVNIKGNTLTIGHNDDDIKYIKASTHSDGNAGRFYIEGADATAGQTDKGGGHLNLFGGQSTGTGEVGGIGFYGGICAASTGSSLNSNTNLLSKIQAITSADNYTSQKWFEGGGMGSTDYFAINTYQHGLTHLVTHDQSSHAADLLINVDGSITLDAHTSHDIYFHENGVERIQWHMDSTPTMEVTGDFTIDGSGDIEINADGGDITFKDASATLASISAKGIVGSREFTRTSNTHFEYQGDVLYFGGGSTTQGDLCYLKEDGEWGQADADGDATGDDEDRDAMGMLAIALGNDPVVDGMFIKGVITMDYDMGDVGNPIYVKTVAGAMSHSAPTASGDFVRIVGYCLDDANGQIYFNPDNTWVEIA